MELFISVMSQVQVSTGSPEVGWHHHYINMRHCGGLAMVFVQLKDPLELFVKRREFLPDSRFLTQCDMTKAFESDAKTNSFFPSLAVYNHQAVKAPDEI